MPNGIQYKRAMQRCSTWLLSPDKKYGCLEGQQCLIDTSTSLSTLTGQKKSRVVWKCGPDKKSGPKDKIKNKNHAKPLFTNQRHQPSLFEF